MSEKRRDHRGRILHNGEMQLSEVSPRMYVGTPIAQIWQNPE